MSLATISFLRTVVLNGVTVLWSALMF